MANKAPRYKTPRATTLYPYLTTPDEFKGKKEWKVKLVLDQDSPECTELKELIDGLVDEAYETEIKSLKGKAKKECVKYYPYEEEYDEAGEELTGRLIFVFKRLAEYKDKKTSEMKPINIFRYDRFGKRIYDEDIEEKLGKPMTGTVVRVEFEPFQFYNSAAGNAGVSCRIASVQFIDVKQFEGSGTWDSEGDDSGDGGQSTTQDAHEDF